MKELLLYMAKNLVDKPEEVTVEEVTDEEGKVLELHVAEGDMVEGGQVIGYVNEPTKYYATEGSNVYFSLEKDGTPVNPKDYLPEMAMNTLE